MKDIPFLSVLKPSSLLDRIRFARCIKLASAAAAMLAGASVHAATVTWTGASGADWGTGTNWSPTSGPAVGDTALFNTSVASVALASGTTINSITFDTAAGSALTVGSTGGGLLTLQNNGTIQIASTLSGANKTITINAPLKLNGNGNSTGAYTFTNNSATASNVLNIGGSITGNSLGTGRTDLNLRGSNTGLNTISGVISNGSLGNVAIIKSDAGTWCLTGSNTFSGGVSIVQGTLAIAGASGAVVNSTVTVTANQWTTAALTLDSSTGVNAGARAKAVTLNAVGSALTAIGNTSANSVEKITNALTFSGDGVETVTLTPGAGFNEQITAASLSRTGGAVLFRGTNLGVSSISSQTANNTNIAFTAAPTLTNGILPWALVDTSATGFGTSLATYDSTNGIKALTTYDSTVSSGSTTTSNLKLSGGGDVTLAASTNTTVNSVTLSGGNLLGSGTLQVAGGAIFAASTGAISGPVAIGNSEGFFNAATGATLNINNLVLTGTGGVNLGTNGGGAVNLTVASSGTLGYLAGNNNYNNTSSLTLAKGVDLTLGVDNQNTTYYGTVNGSGNLIKKGTGTFNIAPAISGFYAGNHYSGNIEIAAGQINVSAGVSNQYSYASWVTTGTLQIDAAGTLSFGGGSLGAGALVGSGALSMGNRFMGVDYNGPVADTFSGAITTANPNGAFQKFGAGTLSLTGNLSGMHTALQNMWGTTQTLGLTGSGGVTIYGGAVKVTGTTGSVTGQGYSSSSAFIGQILIGGTLWIAPDTVSGGAADIAVTGLTSTGVSGGQAMNFNASGGRILLDKGGNHSVSYGIGGATLGTLGTFVVGDGLIVAAAHGLSALGSTEKFIALSGSMVPTMTHGIVSTKILGQDASSGSSFNGDFLAYSGTGSTSGTDGGFTAFNYGSATGNIDFSSATTNATVEKVTLDKALSSDTAVFALRNDGKTISIASGKTLTIGDNSTAAAGLIMNGGMITGGTLAFSSATTAGASIYTSASNATISSTITESSTQPISIQGPGVLTYSGGAFAKTFRINSGATLESSTSSFTGPLSLSGGVYQGSGTYARTLGTGNGNVAFLTPGAGGGFAARGGALNVNLNSLATLNWNNGDSTAGYFTTNFLADNQSFIFGSATADSEVNFMNPLNLGGNTANFSRVIHVIDNPNSTGDWVRFSGGISSNSANNGIVKDGAGKMILAGVNTYQGATIVNNGLLIVEGSLVADSAVTINPGGTMGGSGTAAGAISVGSGGSVNPGDINAAGTTVIGTLSTGAVTFNSGSRFGVDLSGDAADKLAVTGNAALSGTLTLNATGTQTLGKYQLLTTTGVTSGAFTSITGTPTAYRVATASNEVNLVHLANISLSATAANINAHVGDNVSVGFNLVNATPVNSDTLTYSFNGGSNTDLASGSTGALLNTSVTATVGQATVSGTVASTGSYAMADGNSSKTVSSTVTGYNLASAASTATVNIGAVLAGTSKSAALALTNSAAASGGYTETLRTTGTTGLTSGFTASGAVTGLAAGGTDSSISVGFGSSLTAGHQSGLVILGLQSNAVNGSGLGTTSVGSQTVTITGDVYAAAVLSHAQSVASGTTTFTMGNAGTGALVANATVSNVSLSNAQTGFATAMSGSTSIATGSSAAVATFDSNGKLNGTYKGTLGYTAQNDASIAGAAANDLTSGSAGSTALSVSVIGKTGSGTAQILAGGSYKDYGIDTSAALSATTGHTTTATILGGTNTTVAAVNLTMTLSNAALIKSSKYLSSNAVDISGIDGTMFVLQMNYELNSNVGTDPYYIGWWNGTQWVNAIGGNSTSNGTTDLLGNNAIVRAYDASTDYHLGLYGFDSTSKIAWAVVDHNSEFAVIPEPSTWAMLVGGLGMLVFGQRLRRRTNA